ncbi:metallophosphoesterase family protein [Streptomyces sp. NPDC090052]|uniref:metallophosphoesterase family protein n=1 Tax=Streptomyces sp. NPDC090052 TaxID=3365931 RepID=UPI0037FF55A3
MSGHGKLLAISDLHVRYEDNEEIVQGIRPDSDDDWLLVAGDVGETSTDIHRTLELLADRFSKVIWVPGNHELWTTPDDPLRLNGVRRYEHLVAMCRELGVVTPEDPFPVWEGADGPTAIAPLFVLYDYSFLPAGAVDKQSGLAIAERAGIVCSDEFMLHPDPYPSREAWCRARLESTEARLAALPADLPTVLVNHFPLVREPTFILTHPEFAMWCGTVATADWPTRFRASAVVYGHLHIPRLIHHDGVPHHEVSLGYPREWRRYGRAPGRLVEVLPAAAGRSNGRMVRP